MFIKRMLRDIKIQRWRNFTNDSIELKCSAYQNEDDFPIYNRLADLLWKIIAIKVIPKAMSEADVDWDKRTFLMNTTMTPARLITLYESESDGNRYLLTCTDKASTTAYNVWFTMIDNNFEQLQNDLKFENICIKVKNKTNIHEFRPKWMIMSGAGVYKELVHMAWYALTASIELEFENTEEEDESMSYLTPDWVNRQSILGTTRLDGNHCHWECYLPDGSYHAEATFDISEVPAT